MENASASSNLPLNGRTVTELITLGGAAEEVPGVKRLSTTKHSGQAAIF
jgi:hypothetical protein